MLPDGAPPIPSANAAPGDGERRRRPNPVVGGYAYTRPTGVVEPTPFHAYLQRFDPYRERDQRRILARLVNQGTIYDLQQSLVAAGLLDDTIVAFGYLDDATSDAFAHILAIANQHGMSWQDVLSQSAAGGGIGGNPNYGGGGPGALAPTVIQLPNRDDLVAAVQDTGFGLTGQMLDDDLQQSAVDSVLDALRTQQERQVQAEQSAPGGEVSFTESAPDVGRLLEEEVRERAPDFVMSKGVRDAMDDWFSALGGPV